MKKKIIILVMIFTFGFASRGYCFFDLLFGGLSFLGSQIGSLITGITQAPMIKQTIDGAKMIQNNYNDTMKLYNDAMGLGGIGQDAVDLLKGHAKDSVINAWEGAGKDMPTIGKYLGGVEQKSLDYMQKNWDFGDQITKRIQERDKQLTKVVDKLAAKDEQTRMQGQLELNAIMVDQNQDQQRILLKLVELQMRNQELEKELKAEKMKMNQEEQAKSEKSIEKIIQDRRNAGLGEKEKSSKSLEKGIVGEKRY